MGAEARGAEARGAEAPAPDPPGDETLDDEVLDDEVLDDAGLWDTPFDPGSYDAGSYDVEPFVEAARDTSEAARDKYAGSDAVGADPVGADLIGTDPVGSDPIATGTVGTGTVGADPIGSPALPSPAPRPAVPFIEQPAGFVKPVEEVTGLRGFRGWLHRISGGAIFGPSAEERAEAELDRRIRRGIGGSQNTAFLSLKGGVGKTSTTIGVGLTLAGIREGSVCAIDANPDAGDLIERALGEGAYESQRELTITRLLQQIGPDESRGALDSYLHEASRLRLLAGEQDPELSDSLTAEDYRRVYDLVSRHYGVTLTDCGTGVSGPAMRGILENADNVVVAAGFAVSGAKRARDTLAWLASHGFGELARNAIVVVTDKDGVSARVDKAAIEATLGGMCRVLISVPHDNAIADGDLISLASLRPDTRRAYRKIAAAIVDGYR